MLCLLSTRVGALAPYFGPMLIYRNHLAPDVCPGAYSVPLRNATKDTSVNQHPAIDVERNTREICRQVAREEQAWVRDVVRVAEAAKRNALDDVGAHLRRELVAGDVGLDEARCDRVDADAVRAEFTRHRTGEAEHARLRGAVVRAAEDTAAALRGNRRHAHDAPALLLAHLRDDRLRHVER